MLERHGTIREGVAAGLIGATAVAGWFLILDGIAGQPFQTPIMLGGSLASLLRAPEPESSALLVVAYTLFHYAVFVAAGLAAAGFVRGAEREPSVLVALLVLVVAIQVGWYGLTTLLAASPRFGPLTWYQVMVANLIAAVAMGWYFLGAHPGLPRRFAEALAGEE